MQGRETNRSGEILKGVKAQAGQKFFSWIHTHAGATDAVTFEAAGMPDMKDTAYRIFIESESTESLGDALSVDYSSKSKTGFSFVGGTAAELTHILVHGNVAE